MVTPQGSLLLYKGRPALTESAGDKIAIALEDGKTLRVRPKDVVLLHPGPATFPLKDPGEGDVEGAWELLQGEEVSLEELAGLIYGTYTPDTAWAAWRQVADGLFFEGAPEAIRARPPQAVAATEATRKEKAREAEAKHAFLEGLREGRIVPGEIGRLKEVKALALGKTEKSRILKALDLPETPEAAHALLLRVRHWDETLNPHPLRLGLPLEAPDLPLPPLPEEERVDLTHLPAFAIDDEGNRDPDDALSLEGNRLWVHVADVSSLVPPDSPADKEARHRGATLYLPERTVPMLPERALETLGLGLANVSPALSFAIELTGEGDIAHVEVIKSWVKVERMSYEEAQTRLHEPPLAAMWSMAMRFQERRRRQGAVFLAFPEVSVRVVEGEVVLRPLPNLKSRTLVTEAMLMAGEAAARFALEEGIPFPFATQPPPEVQEHPKTLSAMYAHRKRLAPRQMKASPEPHAGLGLPAYAQVTSPLRRYLDLVAHQQLRAYLDSRPLLDTQAMLERVAAAEAVSGRNRKAERASNQHWTLVHLQRLGNWEGEGVLLEKKGTTGTVLIPELNLETRLHVGRNHPLDATLPLIFNKVDLPRLEARFRLRT